jgi:hypothetical protein
MSGGPEWEPIEPPAPKPAGPQPLRLGQVLEIGVRILRRHWPVMLLLALLFAGPGALLTAATGMRFNEVILDIFPAIQDGQVEAGMVMTQAELDRALDALLPYLAATVVAGVLASIGALAFAAVVADDYHARTPTLAVALRRCLARTPGALGFILLTTLIVVGVLVLGALSMAIALIILPTSSVTAGGPGVFLALIAGVATAVAVVYLTMRWAPAFPAMVEEDIGTRDAFRRSWHLSGDNVWRILIIALLGALVTALASSLLAGLFSLLLVDVLAPVLGLDELVAESIGLALGAVLLAPLVPVLTAVLYFDLRARRDPPATTAAAPAR